jgi:hypothetical protein
MTVGFFSRNLGVQRLAIFVAVCGLAFGVHSNWRAFRNLERQRYWAKYVRSWVDANPGSRLEMGHWAELLLVRPADPGTTLPKGYDQIIQSFGYTSADSPELSAYGLLALVILAYALVPLLLIHAFAWIIVGFRSAQHFTW